MRNVGHGTCDVGKGKGKEGDEGAYKDVQLQSFFTQFIQKTRKINFEKREMNNCMIDPPGNQILLKR